MNRTKIPWASHTWNPITGCSPISAGCDHCYAAAMARRFRKPWGKPVFHPDRLGQPKALKEPALVFVCSVSDLWHTYVDAEWRSQIFGAMTEADWHTYILLTKRPLNIPHQFACDSNWWLGVTAETQQLFWQRFALIEKIEAPVHFVSIEPMLEQMSFVKDLDKGPPVGLCVPDWVIVGPETGPGKRPCPGKWIDQLEDETRHVLGRPFFDKRPGAGRCREWPQEKETTA